MRYLWKFYDHEPETVEKLSRQLGVSLLTAKCLFNRGYRTSKEAEEFLNPFLRNLSDPFLIPDIEIAVERLIRAKDKGEAITIFGDYDVDGITATAILSDFFCTLGWNYQGSYLPLRMEEGYGLSDDGVRHCLRKYPKTQLLLAVDCGSTSSLAINQIQKSGVEVIVLDHHQIDPHDTPTPKALVNPRNLPPGEQPSDKLLDLQNLCSAGLAFKLAHAILKYARQKGHSWGNSFDLKSILDLVAMGTIADLVKLQGENRILVSHGLNRITNTQRTGLRELVRISQRKTISVHDVSFYLAPRLNAAGRLEDAQIALKLLTTTNPETGAHLAKQLDSVNLERKGIQNRIVEEVVERVKRNFNPEKDFMPNPGKITGYVTPGGFGVRVDSHVYQDYSIPPYYDSMIGKLICWGRTRNEARRRMYRALKEYVVTGIETTIPFHQSIIEDPVFISGNFNTGFIEDFYKRTDKK